MLADLAPAGHHVEHAGGEAGLVQRLGEDEVAERRLRRWLEHHGAPGGERGAPPSTTAIVTGAFQGTIAADDADREQADQAGPLAGLDLPLELEGADQLGVVVEHRGDQAGLGLGRLADGAAHLLGGDAGDLVGALAQQVGARTSRSARCVRRHPRPGAVVERGAGGRDGVVDVGVDRERDRADDLLGGGGDDRRGGRRRQAPSTGRR